MELRAASLDTRRRGAPREAAGVAERLDAGRSVTFTASGGG
jgi:hypothetical protein